MNYFLMKIKQLDISNYVSVVVVLLYLYLYYFLCNCICSFVKKNLYKLNDKLWFREYMIIFVLKCVLFDSLLIQKIQVFVKGKKEGKKYE